MAVRWLTDDEQESWRAVLRFAVGLIDHLEADLRGRDLDHADYEVLVHLSEAPDRRLRMTELANRVLVSKSRLTYRVDQLVDAGLVRRERCEADRRGSFAVLTSKGLHVLERLAPVHVQGVRDVLVDRLSADEFATLGRIAAKLVADDAPS